MEKRFWVFPDHFDAMRAAVRLRYDLSPYIYGAAREAYDTGISMCRPLYYEYPEDSQAYDFLLRNISLVMTYLRQLSASLRIP